ncbi:MOSC domain-containing protein [Vogesella oryzae]|uniref:MOSC domain-containing protein n=1 Tax=Vogesella oryzae TaxID=1735285 RepID=UPI001581FD6C|nr:MOSC domain-containing protein [Vogesella oryzae]
MELSQLYLHPLKSCHGIAVPQAEVTPQGLLHDRVWLLVRPDGSQITARTHHRLVLVEAQHLLDDSWQFRAPGAGEFITRSRQFAAPHRAQVWKSEFTAWQGDAAADAWFSAYLGEPVQLLWLGSSTRRFKDTALPLSFADGAPFLLIGEASLDDLNQRLAAPVSMRHFRPNLVVKGAFPFEEDEWQRVRIGEVEFEVVSRCTRCIFTTIDPQTAQPHEEKQPLATLMGYRRMPEGVCFGVNLLARNSGRLQLGDAVEVLAGEVAFD